MNFDLAFSMAFAIADLIDIGSSIVVSGEKSFHGCLTPDNIFIDYDGKILLKNYGIYPYLSKDEEILTELEKKYGAWIAPELLRKERAVPQSDIYHLGYIIYRILTGKYFSCTPDEDFDSKFSNISFIQHIPSSDKDFLTNIINFFKKTLNPTPSKRFSNIKEIKDFISVQFHIEELSSITFNLAYFMNSLYLEYMEEENKTLANELAYIIPEAKKEEPVKASKSGDQLVEEILTGLDDRKKSKSKLIIPLVAVIIIIVAVSAYLYINNQNRIKKAEQEKEQIAAKKEMELKKKLDDLAAQYQEKLKSIETKVATTEEEKKAQEDQLNKLKDWQKEETRKALEKQKAEEDRVKKIEEDKKKKQEEEENQKKLEDK
jgi:serine/threonine-protein kinase